MTSVRRFTCDDLFTFNNVNLDYFTETVSILQLLLLLQTLPCKHCDTYKQADVTA